MIGEENEAFKANTDHKDKIHKDKDTKTKTIIAIKNQLCNPCNKNLCFIKPKQVLNCKVHNLGKTASRFLFW